MRYRSHLSVFGDASPSLTRRATQLGYYMLLHSRITNDLEKIDAAHLNRCVLPAINQRRIIFYFDEFNNIVGSVIWAKLADDVRDRVVTYGRFSLHDSEWMEGEDLWVVEVSAPYGHLKYMLQDLRDNKFRDHSAISYMRKKPGSFVCKQLSLERSRCRNSLSQPRGNTY